MKKGSVATVDVFGGENSMHGIAARNPTAFISSKAYRRSPNCPTVGSGAPPIILNVKLVAV